MIPTIHMPEAMEDNDQMPVDPLELVDALGPLLGPQGDVLGEEEAEKLVRFMKDSPKLVSQSICCNIIRATTDWSILMKLAGSGMWETLYEWLQDAKGDADVTLQLLQVYMHLPVSINLLKRNSCAKLIKTLSKDSRPDVSKLASEIVEKWTMIIRGDAEESSEKEKLKKNSSVMKKKDGSSASSAKSSSNSTSTSSSAAKSKSVTLAKSNADSAGLSKSAVKDGKMSSTATDSKQKPQTVKVAPVKLRSTGLEQEIQIPVKKKGDKLPHKRPNAAPASASQEKRLKLTISTAGGSMSSSFSSTSPTSSSSAAAPADVPGKIKLIPAKKQAPMPEVYESSSFMDALLPKPSTAVARKTQPPQRRPSVSKGNGIGATSPPDKQLSPSDNDGVKVKGGEDKFKGRDDKSDVIMNGESKSSSGKKKKSVRWVEESRLKIFHYFELDEDERINVNKVHHSFADTKKAERMMEGKAFHTAKMLSETEGTDDKMAAAPVNGWRTPQPIDMPTASTFVPGCNSNERNVQKQRELSVLQALFFSKDMLPDTPAEPDVESYELLEPHNIPLRDEASDTEVAFPAYPLPVDTAQWQQQQRSLSSAGANGATPFSLPPDLARLLADMAQTSVMNGAAPAATSPTPLLPAPTTSAQPAAAPWGMDGAPPSLPPHVQAMVGTLMSQTAGGTIPAAPGTEELMGTLRRALEPMLNNINALQALVPQPVLYMLWPQGPPPPPMGGMRPQYGLLGHTPPAFTGPAPYGRMPPRMGEWGPMGPGGPMMRGRPPVGPMRPRFAHPAMAGPPRGQVCKFFGTVKGCINGDQCPYIHPRPAAPPAAANA